MSILVKTAGVYCKRLQNDALNFVQLFLDHRVHSKLFALICYK